MVVGNWQYEIYETAFVYGLKKIGIKIDTCKLNHFFQGKIKNYYSALPPFSPNRWKLNNYVLSSALKKKPDWIFFWRPTHIFPKTIKYLRNSGIKTISYVNDDPFSIGIKKKKGRTPWHHKFLWYYYFKCLSYFDKNFFYRKINCKEALAKGAKHADIFLPYFIPKKDKPVILNPLEKKYFQTDVVFVGHYENDGREKFIHSLLKAGIKLKIWGGSYWNKKVLGKYYDYLSPIIEVRGKDYAKALCGAKICLVFLSKLNRDTFTRRCFEIPACGRVMLAERTNDLKKMFKENEEACFFSSKKELLEKINWLLKNPKIRRRIAKAGLKRVWLDGHYVENRSKEIIKKLLL